MIKGVWFDSFMYEGIDPEREVNCEICNGTVFSKEELTEAIENLKTIANDTTSEPTKQLLFEIIDKAGFGLEFLE